MSVSQTQFRGAIFDANAPVPEGLEDEAGRPAGKRFNVYRNNVAVSLTEALEIAFPVVLKLVGDEFFHALAGVFLRQHPPSTPMLMYYGDKLPGFLRNFKPAAHLGYLPDVALLEQMIRQSYHAADATPIDPAALQSLSTDALMAAKLHIAPSAFLVRSTWPIHAIWRANSKQGAPEPQMRGEDVLISRVEFDPEVRVLPAGGADFVQALQTGESFGSALGKAKTIIPDFDLTTTLGALIAGTAIVGIEEV